MNVVVISTYNEAGNIDTLLGSLRGYQVVLVDDNSPDGTAELARAYNNVEVIVRTEEKGIASAYLRGFKEALKYNPKYIIQMDAGLTHKVEDILRLVIRAKLLDADLIIGSRFENNLKIESYRTIISLCARIMMNFVHINVSDATSGFRCWKASTLEKIIKKQILSKGFAFQLELLYEANKVSGGNIYTIPIEYRLTNSSFNPKMLLEALWVYSILLLS